MTTEEKIKSLIEEGYAPKGEPYYETFLLKKGNPYLGHGHFDRKEFFKYKEETYLVTEFEKEINGKTEKRYAIENKNGAVINKSLGKLRYFDRTNRELIENEERCINKFSEYGIFIEPGDIFVSLGYIPNDQEVDEFVENAREAINNPKFADRLYHNLKRCGHEKQFYAIEKLFNGGNDITEDQETKVPSGANSSHEKYIVDKFVIPILRGVMEQELEKGNSYPNDLARLLGDHIIELNEKNYLKNLTIEDLMSKGLSHKVSKGILERLEDGESIDNLDRLQKPKDAIRLAKDMKEVADFINVDFDKDKFLIDYMFASTYFFDAELEHCNIGSYQHLKEIAKIPENIGETLLTREFFEHFEKTGSVFSAANRFFTLDEHYPWYYKHFSDDELQEYDSFWTKNYKTALPYIVKDLTNPERVNETIDSCIRSFGSILEDRLNKYLRYGDPGIIKYESYHVLCGQLPEVMHETKGKGCLTSLVGKYLANRPEYKDLADKLENIITSQLNHAIKWQKKYNGELIHFTDSGEVYRHDSLRNEINNLCDYAKTPEDRIKALNTLASSNFDTAESIEEFEKNIYNLSREEKKYLIDKEMYIDKFKEDDDDNIKVNVIRKVGYERVNYPFPLLQNYEVQREIADQGYLLDRYLNYSRCPDGEEGVLYLMSENWLKCHNVTLDEYIEKYPDRCYYERNRTNDEPYER